MKKLTTALIALSLLISMTTGQVQARENGMDGLLLGAGGGALIGQAIGRNTEATLIGTAVGSMLGYIVGNERDKAGVQNRVAYSSAKHYPQTRYVEVVPQPQAQPQPICRETEMLAEIDGRAEKVYGTACLENGEWVVASTPELISQTIVIEKARRHHPKRKAHYRRSKHRQAHRYYDRPVIYRQVW